MSPQRSLRLGGEGGITRGGGAQRRDLPSAPLRPSPRPPPPSLHRPPLPWGRRSLWPPSLRSDHTRRFSVILSGADLKSLVGLVWGGGPAPPREYPPKLLPLLPFSFIVPVGWVGPAAPRAAHLKSVPNLFLPSKYKVVFLGDGRAPVAQVPVLKTNSSEMVTMGCYGL